MRLHPLGDLGGATRGRGEEGQGGEGEVRQGKGEEGQGGTGRWEGWVGMLVGMAQGDEGYQFE